MMDLKKLEKGNLKKGAQPHFSWGAGMVDFTGLPNACPLEPGLKKASKYSHNSFNIYPMLCIQKMYSKGAWWCLNAGCSGGCTAICRLCHGISVTHGASKMSDAVMGVVTKFRHHTELCTLTTVLWVQTGISTYSFHPVESNSFTQLYSIFFLQIL